MPSFSRIASTLLRVGYTPSLKNMLVLLSFTKFHKFFRKRGALDVKLDDGLAGALVGVVLGFGAVLGFSSNCLVAEFAFCAACLLGEVVCCLISFSAGVDVVMVLSVALEFASDLSATLTKAARQNGKKNWRVDSDLC